MIFDFDGTIADSAAVGQEVFNQLAEKYGFRPVAAEEIKILRGMTTSQCLRHCRVPRLKLPAILIEARQLLAARMDEILPCEGIVEVLPELSRKFTLLGILTSNSEANVRRFLEKYGLDCFDFVSTVPKLTGKARRLRTLIKAHGLAPENVIFAGDESRDMKAAQKAGVHGAGVLWGTNSSAPLALYAPRWILESPAELLQLAPDGM
nr:HAD-IA family hydrolase [Ruficoccus amylovorans]